MNLPVSLAIRGRHADDDQGRAAWAAVMATLREADAVFSTWRPDSHVSRLGRGELALADCPPEVAEVLALGELAARQPGGAFGIRRVGPGGEAVLDPTGVVKGWAAERAADHLRALDSTDFCLSAGGTWSAGHSNPEPRPGGSASSTRTTPAGSSPSCRSPSAPWPPRGRRTAATTWSTPAAAGHRPGSPR
jgi:thiamine biosynthesis lipoprotein